jgi:class 3 adenylate cyclase
MDRRARSCACSIVDAVDEIGLDVRAGLHTGECELIDGKAAGIAVHTGARVASKASPGEVLASNTVKDLVAAPASGSSRAAPTSSRESLVNGSSSPSTGTPTHHRPEQWATFPLRS